MNAAQVRADAADLQAFCVRVLEALGASSSDARIVADSLVDADLRGLDDHGVPARLPNYVARLRAGGIVPDGSRRVVADAGAVIGFDAGDGFGQVAAREGMQVAMDRAQLHGIGIVGVHRSNHLGALSYWTRMATQAGTVGFAVSGAAARIAPWGGAEPLLGTNPWSVGFPTAGDAPPFVVDVSNGAVLSGELVRADEAGEQIPVGWALDQDGRPTRSPKSGMIGSMLPFGGAKGAALTLALEVLASVFTGAAFSRHVPDLNDLEQPQRLGHVFAALPVDAFVTADAFTSRLEELLGWIEHSKPAEGVGEVRIPGVRGERTRERRLAEGIPMSGRTAALWALAGDVGVRALEVR